MGQADSGQAGSSIVDVGTCVVLLGGTIVRGRPVDQRTLLVISPTEAVASNPPKNVVCHQVILSRYLGIDRFGIS